ncbi:MAG: hypothetical protein ACOWYE_09835 [Desulfatiglandales bacterium]
MIRLTLALLSKKLGKGPSRCLAASMIFFLTALLLDYGNAAEARVVGLVVDDSGSMANRFETPLYATQIIISILNTQDRCFVTRLSAKGDIQEVDLAHRNEHMKSMRNHWYARQNVRTPYSPLDRMLERLVEVTEKGESASLLVVTDGHFTDEVPSAATLFRRYEDLRKKFRGESLQAFFVAFAPRGSDGDGVLAEIREQKVSENLLKVFNGREDVGSVTVREGRELYRALMDIIAQMVGVDPRKSEDFISHQDNVLKLHTPFTVSRLVIISTGSGASKAASVAGESIRTRERDVYHASMRKTDHLTRSVLGAGIYHLIPWPPLSSGKEEVITFDRSLGSGDVRVIFETAVRVLWEIHDRDGRTLPVDANGTIEIPQGQKFFIKAFLTEPKNGKEERIDFSSLPQKFEFSLHYEGQNKTADTSKMDIDMSTSTATGAVKFDRPGRYTVAVTARYPGFINKRARDLSVVIKEEMPVHIKLDAQGTGVCPGCSAERVELTYTVKEPYQDVLAVDVRSSAPAVSEYDVELRGTLPEGVRIKLPDGDTFRGGTFGKASLSCGGTKSARLLLQYNRDYDETAERDVSLTARARAPQKGEATLRIHLVPVTAGLTIEPAGSTLDPSGKDPFRLRVTSLDQGHGIYVKANGLQAPLHPDHIRVEGENIPFVSEIQEGTNLILLIPQKKWWCDCLTPSGTQDVTLTYRHPKTRQQASYTGAVELVPVGLWERCWREILGFLVFLFLILKMWCLALTYRFPRRSCLCVERQDAPYNKQELRLHRWRDYAWPPCGSAARKILGFNIQAGPNGVLLRHEKWYTDSLVGGMGTLPSQFEENGFKPMTIGWGEVIMDNTDTMNQITYRFVRDNSRSGDDDGLL